MRLDNDTASAVFGFGIAVAISTCAYVLYGGCSMVFELVFLAVVALSLLGALVSERYLCEFFERVDGCDSPLPFLTGVFIAIALLSFVGLVSAFLA